MENWRKKLFKLSIICLTYNHARFVRDALDGFVSQKTNFPFEVIIHDDASTDGTTEIIKEYERKYPDIIKPIYQTENQWRKAKTMSKTFVFPHVQGEYVAFCEGDDYWTDKNKLQKQVDFLDAHPECSICFHPVKVTWDDGRENDTIYPDATMLKKVGALNFENLLKRNFIQTNSVVYRWRFHKDSYDQIPDGVLPGDWFLHLLHAQIGQIGFLPEVMAVYRRNAGGIWTGAEVSPQWFCRFGKAYMRFWDSVEKQFGVNKLKEREFLRRAVFYANLYCKRDNLDEKYEDIKAPYEKAFLNILELFFLRCLKKITSGKTKDLYSAKYRSLKLYNSWLKDKAHLKAPVND